MAYGGGVFSSVFDFLVIFTLFLGPGEFVIPLSA